MDLEQEILTRTLANLQEAGVLAPEAIAALSQLLAKGAKAKHQEIAAAIRAGATPGRGGQQQLESAS